MLWNPPSFIFQSNFRDGQATEDPLNEILWWRVSTGSDAYITAGHQCDTPTTIFEELELFATKYINMPTTLFEASNHKL